MSKLDVQGKMVLMANHGHGCMCSNCVQQWASQQYGDGSGYNTGGTCGDCIHCVGGYYPRRDGSQAPCGKCRGRGNRKHPYLCHVCKGKGYGGGRCKTPSYQETVERNNRGKWQSGGTVDGQSARTKQSGGRTDAIWGGSQGNQRGDGHGHIVSKDGVNAEYLRDPGMDHDDYVVDSDKDNPYGG